MRCTARKIFSDTDVRTSMLRVHRLYYKRATPFGISDDVIIVALRYRLAVEGPRYNDG